MNYKRNCSFSQFPASKCNKSKDFDETFTIHIIGKTYILNFQYRPVLETCEMQLLAFSLQFYQLQFFEKYLFASYSKPIALTSQESSNPIVQYLKNYNFFNGSLYESKRIVNIYPLKIFSIFTISCVHVYFYRKCIKS